MSEASAQDNRPPDPNNQFIYPPLPGPGFSDDPTVFGANINITVGQQHQPFKWVSNLNSMFVSLHQEGDPDVVNSVHLTECQPGSSNYVYWNGYLGKIDLAIGSQAFLAAWNCEVPDSTPVFYSHYFNLTKADSSSSSTSTTSPSTPSPTQSLTSTSLSASTPTENPTSTTSLSAGTSSSQTTSSGAPPDSKNNNNNNNNNPVDSAAIGGGVGGGIGGAILLVGVAIALLKYWKQSPPSQQLDPHAMYVPTFTTPSADTSLRTHSVSPHQTYPVELPEPTLIDGLKELPANIRSINII
ncbi:hypothetical protein HD806DRAFT_545048 [Xylariaceae sp. AK1471]|nr:hypothetical protein HD806DRAFT_545048 [Xylariaceae sp. AK1471]